MILNQTICDVGEENFDVDDLHFFMRVCSDKTDKNKHHLVNNITSLWSIVCFQVDRLQNNEPKICPPGHFTI